MNFFLYAQKSRLCHKVSRNFKPLTLSYCIFMSNPLRPPFSEDIFVSFPVLNFAITTVLKNFQSREYISMWVGGNPSCSCSGQGFADSRYHQGIIMAKSLSFFSDSILLSLLNFLMWRCSLPSANLRIWKKPESCQVHRKQVGRKKQRDFLSSSAFFVTTAVKITLL